MDHYRLKYLKYKIKYLKLEYTNMYGGEGDDEVCLKQIIANNYDKKDRKHKLSLYRKIDDIIKKKNTLTIELNILIKKYNEIKDRDEKIKEEKEKRIKIIKKNKKFGWWRKEEKVKKEENDKEVKENDKEEDNKEEDNKEVKKDDKEK